MAIWNLVGTDADITDATGLRISPVGGCHNKSNVRRTQEPRDMFCQNGGSLPESVGQAGCVELNRQTAGGLPGPGNQKQIPEKRDGLRASYRQKKHIEGANMGKRPEPLAHSEKFQDFPH